MAASAPALTAVHEALQNDARLMQLKLEAQTHIIRSKGSKGANAAACQASSSLVTALTSSSVLQVQHQHVMQGLVKQQTTAAGSAVLEVLLQQWQRLMQERLHAAQMLLPDIPLVAPARTPDEMDRMQGSGADDSLAWRQIGHRQSPFVNQLDAAPACIKLMYAAEDLLEALTVTVAVANCCGSDNNNSSSVLHSATTGSRPSSHSTEVSEEEQPAPALEAEQRLSLLQCVHAPNRVWLQSFFAELQPDKRQVGLDDVLHPWYRDQQTQQACIIAASCSAAACRAAARTGVPASQRPYIWATALGLPACPPAGQHGRQQHVCEGGDSPHTQQGCQENRPAAAAGPVQDARWQLPNPRHEEQLHLLCEAVKQQALLVDALTCADVQQMADDAHFFVFEEAMRAVLLAFSRDASIATTAAVPPHPVMAAGSRPIPGSGVLPFQGQCAYLAPLCYLYGSPAAIYPVWREMYCRYWCYLHTLNASPAPSAGLPVLCRTFLDLLQEVDCEVYAHMCSLASPLEFAFPWLWTAFASHLAPNETLLLWDRIIGFDSLLPLPVLAVAVLTFRRDLVLAAETSEELAELLQDLGQLRVVPLLQALLFDA